MTAKIQVKGLSQVRKEIQKKIKDAVTDKGLAKGIGQNITKEVKKTIRSGISPKTEKKFKKLKPSTIKSRRSFSRSKKGRKSPYFSVSKSNLTMTGKMVRSIRARSIKNKIIIDLKGMHHGSVTNQQLAEWHDEGAGKLPKRSIFGIRKKTQEKIVKALEIFLKRKLK